MSRPARQRCYRCNRRRAFVRMVRSDLDAWCCANQYGVECEALFAARGVCACCGKLFAPLVAGFRSIQRLSSGTLICVPCSREFAKKLSGEPQRVLKAACRVPGVLDDPALLERFVSLCRATDRLAWRAWRFSGWPVRDNPSPLRELRAELMQAKALRTW